MAKFEIEVPASVDYKGTWANKLPQDKRVEIDALDGGMPKKSKDTTDKEDEKDI